MTNNELLIVFISINILMHFTADEMFFQKGFYFIKCLYH